MFSTVCTFKPFSVFLLQSRFLFRFRFHHKTVQSAIIFSVLTFPYVRLSTFTHFSSFTDIISTIEDVFLKSSKVFFAVWTLFNIFHFVYTFKMQFVGILCVKSSGTSTACKGPWFMNSIQVYFEKCKVGDRD